MYSRVTRLIQNTGLHRAAGDEPCEYRPASSQPAITQKRKTITRLVSADVLRFVAHSERSEYCGEARFELRDDNRRISGGVTKNVAGSSIVFNGMVLVCQMKWT